MGLSFFLFLLSLVHLFWVWSQSLPPILNSLSSHIVTPILHDCSSNTNSPFLRLEKSLPVWTGEHTEGHICAGETMSFWYLSGVYEMCSRGKRAQHYCLANNRWKSARSQLSHSNEVEDRPELTWYHCSRCLDFFKCISFSVFSPPCLNFRLPSPGPETYSPLNPWLFTNSSRFDSLNNITQTDRMIRTCVVNVDVFLHKTLLRHITGEEMK